MADTLSDTVAKAFDKQMGDASSGAPAIRSGDDKPTPAPEMEYRTEQPVEGAEEVVDDRPTVESVGRERDANGRFVSKDPDAGGKEPAPDKKSEPAAQAQDPAKPPGDAAPATSSEGAPPAEAASDKAPANWKPAAREKWASLPAEVKQEALRLHAEVNKTLQETAEARKTYGEIKEAIAPYEAMMKASGYTPARALQEYGMLNYTVYQGTPEQLGQVVASMAASRRDPDRAARAIAHAIDSLGLDTDLVSKYLGVPGAPAPQAQPQVDVQAAVQQALQAQIQAAMGAKRQQEEQAFAAKNEFYEDVAPRMQVIRKADPNLSLDEAYRIACQMDPEVSKVLQQRAEAAKATEVAKRTAAAKAASGPKPSPAVAVATKPRDLRSSVEAAFDKLSSKR